MICWGLLFTLSILLSFQRIPMCFTSAILLQLIWLQRASMHTGADCPIGLLWSLLPSRSTRSLSNDQSETSVRRVGGDRRERCILGHYGRHRGLRSRAAKIRGIVVVDGGRKRGWKWNFTLGIGIVWSNDKTVYESDKQLQLGLIRRI